MAFAIVAHLSPMVGLYTAAMICVITAFLGGRPGLISGAAGSVAIVSVSLIVSHGVEYLYLAVILMGVIEILVGLLKLTGVMRLISRPVIHGFLNGLAIIIFMSQLNQFKAVDGSWLTGSALSFMILLVAISAVVMYVTPRVTKKVPGGLVAIILVTLASFILKLDTRTIGDIANVSSGLPSFHIPMVSVTFESIMIVLPYAVIMASVGLIETLLTTNVLDEMTETPSDTNRESIAQGISNIFCGFFQGMGGCAMIGQTMVNYESGGRRKLSGVIAGFTILLIIVYGRSLIDVIPLASLVGIMFVVAFNTFEWSSIKTLRSVAPVDNLIMIIVTLITVLLNNLALAVLVGVIINFINQKVKENRRKRFI
ncbi:SulP family inorganic anion transporter [Methanosphaera sp.]